jgi:hypothetical protein
MHKRNTRSFNSYLKKYEAAQASKTWQGEEPQPRALRFSMDEDLVVKERTEEELNAQLLHLDDLEPMEVRGSILRSMTDGM